MRKVWWRTWQIIGPTPDDAIFVGGMFWAWGFAALSKHWIPSACLLIGVGVSFVVFGKVWRMSANK